MRDLVLLLGEWAELLGEWAGLLVILAAAVGVSAVIVSFLPEARRDRRSSKNSSTDGRRWD